MAAATRPAVLGLYRRVLRLARRWQAASGRPEDSAREQQDILREARTLFRKNKGLTDTDQIKQCIDECTARIEIGLHYQIPYPRPVSDPVNSDSSASNGPYLTTRPGTSKSGEAEEAFQASVPQVSRRGFLMQGKLVSHTVGSPPGRIGCGLVHLKFADTRQDPVRVAGSIPQFLLLC
ncbi:LYR motif-containing protein 1 isoform X1 [Pipistrellus kuhlii]|uniref:LYR motif-containing protein 1 isoform X1 n=1 Tax=Pipistrellus kuhlii TaxID=59472 RepID=UPI001E27209C|nr:LYR motif-containing protein 1 isoform X1 [Pipistrellus kuhlii]XP_045445289.1 LYR motif-containing protein 1 isoform X1 [Pipistrellus kuhlii]XP_045445290.1 LYR motif-containing protein 1 isoform X1 [Pipistrellus kuhlii]XP_045445291.1 LYR motif-containing protein 1 isoform X1 [Pipistrellus kuhlii]XP_045445292.1 LYR motif-containing protein 1 isoform X1 [Pipistrellus kuhlii]XP_045445293.1 LYR motif-containing protein 1 isoform X1 [Pipistrellus kuhlii]